MVQPINVYCGIKPLEESCRGLPAAERQKLH
jgi:hypothetical protein